MESGSGRLYSPRTRWVSCRPLKRVPINSRIERMLVLEAIHPLRNSMTRAAGGWQRRRGLLWHEDAKA